VVEWLKAVLPHLKASGCGHIINTSIFGLLPGGQAPDASKFAVRSFQIVTAELLPAACRARPTACIRAGSK
jgi:NADP-dependent 3-hydroxy acid dehydrogenase YdfG